jgi:FKBP-type peptidyl-prolyl cis-trans isomerase FklB
VKQLILAVSALGLVFSTVAEDAQGPDMKASYIIGHQIGSNLERDKAPVDLDEMMRGMKDAMAGKEVGMEMAEIQSVMQAFGERITAAKGAKGKEFQTAFAAEEGVKTTESGLMYQVLTAGKGDSPKASDKVKVNYRGTLIDGTEFDSSYKRGEPAQFGVNRVIPGWTEALQLMKPGDKWKLVIPSELAYGERGAGQMIGPNETLIFEVELLEVLPAAPPQIVPGNGMGQ